MPGVGGAGRNGVCPASFIPAQTLSQLWGVCAVPGALTLISRRWFDSRQCNRVLAALRARLLPVGTTAISLPSGVVMEEMSAHVRVDEQPGSVGRPWHADSTRNRAGYRQHRVSAVSYTHLTLPTSDLV